MDEFDELDDLSTYNGDTEHDMMVDYDYHMNTGELSELFDDEEYDEDYDDDEWEEDEEEWEEEDEEWEEEDDEEW